MYVPAVLIEMFCVVAVKPPGPDHAYEVIPAGALQVVELPSQTTSFPPEILHGGRSFTISVTVELELLQDATFGDNSTL